MTTSTVNIVSAKTYRNALTIDIDVETWSRIDRLQELAIHLSQVALLFVCFVDEHDHLINIISECTHNRFTMLSYFSRRVSRKI